MIIREATLKDASGIARVHTDSWKTTYKGIVCDEYLDGLSYERKEEAWIHTITDAIKDEKHIFVAEDEIEGIVGFTSCGPDRDEKNLYKSELYAIYIIKEFQNQGIGRLLFEKVVEILSQLGYHSMIIWALEKNTLACNFYKSNGGKKIKEKYINIGNETFIEVAYEWSAI